MNEREMVELLRLYRHDLMNDLQIVQGYASMEKMDKVKQKLASLMNYFNEERKLMRLDMPKFTLWLICFNSVHTNIRLSYHINMNPINLQAIDQTLVEECQSVVEMVKRLGNDMEMYKGILDLNCTDTTLKVTFSLEGNFTEDTSIDEERFPDYWEFSKTKDAVNCTISLPITK
ncbi:Spo0B domain-containing protein [Lentibacillus sp. L22]|uniref:Spo0B domain-containing protein n=1 Tax=Lentibacillus TaxID=175304 RepID=UPI0022B17F33|nr:Spo0B domain-containing protein [Lentibacillus daqui]